jgi:hypothetical protein
MSLRLSPHCPTCAAFDHWAVIWAGRRAGVVGEIRYDTGPWYDDVGDGMAESVGYTHARWLVFQLGHIDRLEEARAVACLDFREKLLNDASARMAALVLTKPETPEFMRLHDGTLCFRDVGRYLLVEGYFNLLALHLLEAAARA